MSTTLPEEIEGGRRMEGNSIYQVLLVSDIAKVTRFDVRQSVV